MIPKTADEYRAADVALNARLGRIYPVLSRLCQEAEMLNILQLCCYVRAHVPEAAYVALLVTDQGGDTMTLDGVGVPRDAYLRLPHATSNDAFREVEWQSTDATAPLIKGEFGLIADMDEGTTFEAVGLDEDTIWELCNALHENSISEWGLFYQPGTRHSGFGRLWIDAAFATLAPQHLEVLAGAIDPMPDPNDQAAIGAWIENTVTQEEAS